VAPCGTSLTPRHVDEIKRRTEKVIVCTDADTAGKEAAARAILLFLGAGFDVGLVSLPDKDPDSLVQAGRSAELLKLLQEAPSTLDAYLQVVDASVRRRVSEGAIGLKIVSAYVRAIEFAPASYDDAARCYSALASKRDAERAPLENFIARRLAQYAADHRLPMQIHVGMGHPEPGMRIANSAPFLLESLIDTPSLNRLKIVLLHGGYPFGSELASLAQTYGNVFIDFSWMPYLHHFYLRQKLSEWLEILPANKLLYGSDTSAPEFHVAAASYTRGSLNHVLHDGYVRGVWDAKQVEWLARRILFENTADVYGIEANAGVSGNVH